MYIVLNTFNPLYPNIITDINTGLPLLFDSIEEAQAEANDCQEAIVVEI